MTSSSPLSTPNATNVAYFVGGALFSTLLYYLKPNNSNVGEKYIDEDIDDDEFEDTGKSTSSGTTRKSKYWGPKDAPYKMILCVNKSLGMSKGKIAAQCSHAAVGCFKRSQKQCPAALKAWEWTGCAKIAVSCPTQDEMEDIMAKASERDIPLYMVEDAGRTQIAAGSRTVLGLGPAPVRVFDGLTNHLKLM
mmetsp:Transcript_53157/g.64040  ORF Transcript_53157/g.64040 Transcript_53157/m.64040 type:complete len:192 (-) Transcript_53157:77-652(-)|eukprot:CAMPEP_0172509060 /NCGR_PEP_ID=MMETSP1066-20121228/217265_1 /TAXON_ID=671091 /ORGANISM="Coscinodiscus wailesii, Strain CCMP2513" /LENGTH=191 /DNA_ID=CAMNT_0013287369 /DNA_START=140 /DNA_END=715 /DNA_ORIENTATION=+